jgi:hypothetical protein
MTSYDVYSPTTRPIGSYDSTLIPTRITQRGGIVYVNKLGAPLLPDDAELTVGWLMSRLADMTANDYSLNRLYYDGDHWQMAEGWSGPRPDAGERDAGLALRAIERSFVSKNCIKEVTSRTTNSILSREPSWFLTNKSARGSNETLTAAEEALRREGEAVLTEWWDRTNAAEVLSQANAAAYGCTYRLACSHQMAEYLWPQAICRQPLHVSSLRRRIHMKAV